MPARRLAWVVSSPATFEAFLAGHAKHLASLGYDITVIANFGSDSSEVARTHGVRTLDVPIAREIRPLQDLGALVRLMVIFRRERYDIIHSVTPKAGLLAALAGWLTMQRPRVHMFTGQVWATRSGLSRHFLKSIDRVVLALVTDALADGPAQVEFLRKEGLKRRRIGVLGNGSIAGVDLARFNPSPTTRSRIRGEWGVSQDAIVFSFLGRLKRDKGVLDLVRAFTSAQSSEELALVIVGWDEERLAPTIRLMAHGSGRRILVLPPTTHPEEIYAASDVFCMPSYREGFSMAVLEAGASGIAVIVSRIYGTRGTYIAGQTAMEHSPGDVDALSAAISELAADDDRRRRLGAEARSYVVGNFSAERVRQDLADFYLSISVGAVAGAPLEPQ